MHFQEKASLYSNARPLTPDTETACSGVHFPTANRLIGNNVRSRRDRTVDLESLKVSFSKESLETRESELLLIYRRKVKPREVSNLVPRTQLMRGHSEKDGAGLLTSLACDLPSPSPVTQACLLFKYFSRLSASNKSQVHSMHT